MGSLLPESLDVAAGLVFVYLFMSILATVAREAFEGFMKRRSRNLEKGLIELLCDHPPETPVGKGKITGYEMLKAFYDHPLVMSLYRGRYTIPPKRNFFQGRTLPSYVPSGHFAYVVLDLLSEHGGTGTDAGIDLGAIMASTKKLGNPRLAKMVQFAVGNSGGDVDKARQFLENWFNATMDRASGWYRLETQTLLFWISLVACVLLNVNTVVIADSLYRSPSLRKSVEAAAQSYYEKHAGNGLTASMDPSILDEKDPLDKLGLPLGWTEETRAAMSRLFAKADVGEMPDALPMPVEMTSTGPQGWLDKTLMGLKGGWNQVVNFYNGTPQLGEYTLFNVLPFISLIMGWVMTAFAVTLGAPFWFDILSKLMTVRSTFKPNGGGNGSGDTVATLGALAAAFTPADGASQKTPLLPSYTPSFTSSAAAAPETAPEDDDVPDPSLRPRDA